MTALEDLYGTRADLCYATGGVSMSVCSSYVCLALRGLTGRRGVQAGALAGSLALVLSALLALFSAAPEASGQEDKGRDESKEVAVYEGGAVTVDEFVDAYQKTAARYTGYDISTYKKEILKNIVTDDLLAREAKERGYVDELGEWDPKVISTKETAMVNYLRREVILKGVTVEDAQVRDLYDKSRVRRLTRAITVSNKQDADRVAKELEAGADFVTLAKKVSLDTGSAAWDGLLAWVKVGDGPEEIERLLESLEVGEVAGPLLTDQCYYFLRVDSLFYKDDMPTYEEAKPMLRTKALSRVRAPVIKAFMDSVAQARGVTYNEGAMAAVVDRFQREGWTEDDKPGRGSRIPTYSPEELAMPIFSFDDVSYPVEDYLHFVEDLRVNPAYFLAGREEIERGLKAFVRDKLELYLAYEMGIDQARPVRGTVRHKATTKGVVDMLVEVAGGEESVLPTEAQKRAFYEENKWKYTKPGEIVISIVTVKDGDVVDELYRDMKAGLPFSKVAEDYRWVIVDDRTSERMTLEQEQTEENSRIFNTARRMKVGAVSEPIPIPGRFYSIIKLLEREPTTVLPYEEVSEEVLQDLNLQTLNTAAEKIQEFKDSILKKYNYRVNEEVLAGIQL